MFLKKDEDEIKDALYVKEELKDYEDDDEPLKSYKPSMNFAGIIQKLIFVSVTIALGFVILQEMEPIMEEVAQNTTSTFSAATLPQLPLIFMVGMVTMILGVFWVAIGGIRRSGLM